MNIEQMTLREKIGQLFVLGINGFHISPDIIHVLKMYHVGGIYLGEENVKHPKQVYKLTEKMQNYAKRNHPLFIAMKQNGAELNTLKHHITPGLTPHDLGSLHNRVYTKRLAGFIAKELRGMGINMNLGPMLHQQQDDIRSYSDNTDIIGKQARATIEGYQKEKILAVPGGFPTDADILHSNLPIYQTPLHPFAYVIEHGCNAVLTDNAAQTNDVLRTVLHFDGLIIQDYTSTKVDHAEDVIEAIQAGANLIVLKESNQKQIEMMEAVIEAVKSGIISETAIQTSLEKIASLKEQYITKDIGAYDRDIFAAKRSTDLVAQLKEKLVNS